ncbi:MAG: choice-of-anchor Q domain-containing protein [Geminocystis sp.]|nr:hypothetical protein [Geminocystis sp.]MDW8462729.1 choice-of-anchor Q domain-containing protein [Geminocystis sp.]
MQTITRKIGERIEPILNPPPIDGFFAPGSQYNFIGASSVSGIFNGRNNNIVGSVGKSIDPKLQQVFVNSNELIAYQPLPDSPVVNAGNSAIVGLRRFFGDTPVDQLGNPRIRNGVVDMGSVEANFPAISNAAGIGNSFSNPTTTSNKSNSTSPAIPNFSETTVLTTGDIASSTISNANHRPLLDTPFYRFRNRDLGTYLYVGEREAAGIRSNYPIFAEEGLAFKVATQPGDGLIRINRFRNRDLPGTYLFATEEESVSIRRNYPNFQEEGIAF